MKKFTTKNELQHYLQQQRLKGKSIGFVPTMGALHAGHISLIKSAQQQTDIVVCSIFVNPTQFNDPKDLEKYPRPLIEDIAKLENARCDVLFHPEVHEMYMSGEQWHLDIGALEHKLEGATRPGHYQGVMQVVFKLFDIVQPDKAFFGQKDYQQFLVISKMVELLNLNVQLVMCPIEREADGLAMSSRNIRLSAAERKHALILFNVLEAVKRDFNITDIARLKKHALEQLNNEPQVEPYYFEFVDAHTLEPVNTYSEKAVALVAAMVGSTRLIDNMLM